MLKIIILSTILVLFFFESYSQSLKADYRTAEIINRTLLQMIPIHYGSVEYMRARDYPLAVLNHLIEDDTLNKNKSGSNSLKSDFKERVIILEEGEQISFNKLID